jgi:hypothetical protein
MSTFNLSMFESIKQALTDTKSNTGVGDILQLKPGHTYTVRLLPNVKDPKKTFFHYYSHGWNSLATGKYVSAMSPTTFGERDPIAEERYRVLRTGTEEEKERMKIVRRSEQWMVNVYVVDDPTNPENNGKNKIHRYGKQLNTIINSAISGEDSEEYGPRIFDLGKEGISFKIKVEKQGDYTVYTSSRFTTAGRDLGLSAEKQKNIYEGVFDLETVFRCKSADELKQMLDEHFYCKNVNEVAKPAVTSLPAADEAIAELSGAKAVHSGAFTTNDTSIDDILSQL